MPLPWKRNKSPEPSREDKTRSRTEKIAYELYQIRQLPNRLGDTHTDWEIAERIVQSRLRLALYRCHRPFIRIEKTIWEPLLAWANNQALLSLLGLVGNIGLIIAVTTYIASEKHRRNAELLNAWQTITSAHGQAGSGGRIQALEFLNASPGANWRRKFPWVCAPHSLCTWPSENLAGLNLSIETPENIKVEDSTTDDLNQLGAGVYLAGVQMPKALLPSANLENVNLASSNLEGALLLKSNLKRAFLWEANLRSAHLGSSSMEGAYLASSDMSGANLIGANLSGSNLDVVDLTGATFGRTDFEGASLVGADFKETFFASKVNLGGSIKKSFVNFKYADLSGVDLEGTILVLANFEEANLHEANLKGTFFVLSNLEKAEGLTEAQMTETKLCRTQLPQHISLSPDQNCSELDIDSEAERFFE